MSLKPKVIDFPATLTCILDTVNGVINLNKVQRQMWNDRFMDIYAVCVAYPEPLSDRLYQKTKDYLETHVEEICELVSQSQEDLLVTYYSHWVKYSKGAEYLNHLYRYLNVHYIDKQKRSDADIKYGFDLDNNEQILVVGELALDIWKRRMIEQLREKLVDLLLKEIKHDRCQENPNPAVIHGVISSFIEVENYSRSKIQLQTYQSIFEKRFLQETTEYYSQEANCLISLSVSEYMEKVLVRMDEEKLRTLKFLHPSSYDKVAEVMLEQFVDRHLKYLKAECSHIVQNECLTDLANMYKLLKPVQHCFTVLVNEFQDHVKKTGLDKVSSLTPGDAMASQFIDVVLDVHGRFKCMIETTLNNDNTFINCLDKACSAVVNFRSGAKQISRASEMLSKHCDLLLKKSAKGLSESEIEDKLNQAIIVFRYIDDKDIFQKFYSRMLAKRLIHGLSTSMDAEEGMINKLKQVCGYEFTSKLHRMFTDMSVSHDLNIKFTDYLQHHHCVLNMSFSICVLQTGAWPLWQTPSSAFAIPQELEKSVQMFEKFYSESFSGRILTWLHHLCSGELKLCYLKKPYYVTVTTYQMAVLLLFNNTDTLSYSDCQSNTQISESELLKTIQSLVDVKLLFTDSDPKEGEPMPNTAVLQLNMEFTNKRTKFKITTALQKETPQEVEQTHTSVEEDRKMYLQAAIVRIMKARKILKHNSLIREVIRQASARFSPSISMIKKCIETLIDKQYIERNKDSTDEYSYNA